MVRVVPVKQTSRRPVDRRCRGLRDHHVMELRRMQAADLFERGLISAEIARRVGVAHQVVSDWRKAWRQGGREALRSAGPAGRKPQLNDAQLTDVESALTAGAEANGYLGDLWTLPRVAEVIARVTGVSYHPGHVWYLLRDSCSGRGNGQLDVRSNATTRPSSVGQAALAAREKRTRRQNALILFE